MGWVSSLFRYSVTYACKKRKQNTFIATKFTPDIQIKKILKTLQKANQIDPRPVLPKGKRKLVKHLHK